MLSLNMKIIVLLGVFFMGACFPIDLSQPAQPPSTDVVPAGTPILTGWNPATFKGLILGKASRDDLLRVLGKPVSSYESPDDLPTEAVPDWNDEYDYSEEITGKLVASSVKKSGVLTNITIYPHNLSFARLTEVYGRNFVTTRYGFIECPNDQGSSLMREDHDGEIELVEYRVRGIVIDVRENKVRTIEFVSLPVGVAGLDCPDAHPKAF
ncbi:MAG: hypothetical protein KBD94_08945 [Pyrinomonadaceae bacterium]|nr:hypothetical protein [Pyrinomonadaceae bacterium]